MLCQFNGGSISVFQKGKKCQRTVRSKEPVRITFAGCSTVQLYRPRSCGTCTDDRCCTPSLSRTVRLRFHCSDGEGFYRNVMWIQRCSCSTSCRTLSGPSSPSVSLHNDIHVFRHWGWLIILSPGLTQWAKDSPLKSRPPPCVSAGWAAATLSLTRQYTRLHFKLPATMTSFCPHYRCVTSLAPGQHRGHGVLLNSRQRAVTETSFFIYL